MIAYIRVRWWLNSVLLLWRSRLAEAVRYAYPHFITSNFSILYIK